MEVALILTVALVTFIGILDVGSVVFRLQGLVERARAGARYAVVNSFNATNVKNVVVYGNSAGTGNPLLGLTTSMVTATNTDQGDGTSRIDVKISGYQFQFFTPLIAGAKTLPSVTVTLTTESLGAPS
ncbi:MAG: hypothetical protein HY238_05550 [Acidobacteria bacterium]|nr:hypothetical protein [Acidobacteriota bacterium]